MLIKTGIVLICLYFGYKIAKVLIKKKLKKMLFPNGMPEGMEEHMRQQMHENMQNGAPFGNMGGMDNPEKPENSADKEAELIQCDACESWMPHPPKYQRKGHKYCSKECLQTGPKD